MGAFDQEKVVSGKPRFGGQAIVQGRELERPRVHGHKPMSKSRNSAQKKAHYKRAIDSTEASRSSTELLGRRRKGVQKHK